MKRKNHVIHGIQVSANHQGSRPTCSLLIRCPRRSRRARPPYLMRDRTTAPCIRCVASKPSSASWRRFASMRRCFRILRVCAQACQDLLAAFVVLVLEARGTAAPRTDMGGDGSEPSPLHSCIGIHVRPPTTSTPRPAGQRARHHSRRGADSTARPFTGHRHAVRCPYQSWVYRHGTYVAPETVPQRNVRKDVCSPAWLPMR